MRIRLVALSVIAAVFALLTPETVRPAIAGGGIVVNETSDELNNDGDCSLREAVKASRGNVAVDACPAGDAVGTDIIVLTGGATYDLTIVGPGDDQGDLDAGAGGPLVLQRSGLDKAVIDANGIDRVLHTLGSEVTISSIDFTGGNVDGSGGGILVQSNMLNLTNSAVTNNTASGFGGGIAGVVGTTLVFERLVARDNTAGLGGGGISSSSHLTLTRSIINENDALANVGGGGLTASGTTIIQRSEFIGNDSLVFAGGIQSSGDLTIDETLIADNTAVVGGGGLTNGGTTETSTATLTNVTISGNTSGAPGGGIRNGMNGVVTLLNVTLADNDNTGGGGDAIFGAGVESTNTIISGAGSGCSSSVTSHGHNLESGDTCGLDQPGDIQNADPLLGPLQDNGGPNSTHALLEDSPAIDAGDDAACPDVDQRGEPRPQGNACDIGAYESPFTAPTPSPSPTPAPTPSPTPTASPTPTGQQVTWGDHNCSGSVDPVDGLLNLRHDAGLPTETNECPDMGSDVNIESDGSYPWGDLDCSGVADPVDGLKVLRFDAGLDVARPAECPDPGEVVSITPG